MQTLVVIFSGLVVGYLIGRLFATPRPRRYVRVQPPPLDDTLPPAGESARTAAEAVREFGELVERLAARDVDVYDLQCEPGIRWQLTVHGGASRETEVTRVSWRVGAPDLRVEKSALVPPLFPNRWRGEGGISIAPGTDTLRAAEVLIVEAFATDAGPDR